MDALVSHTIHVNYEDNLPSAKETRVDETLLEFQILDQAFAKVVFLLHPSAGILRFARGLMDRSCGPRLQNLVLSREKRNFAAPDALARSRCEKSWLNVFERLVTPLRLPGKKL